MRALVIGGSGFVGTHLVSHLRAMGDDVISIDRAAGGPDICDPYAINAHIASARADVVYHLAGQSDVGRSWTDVIGTYRANVEGLVNVLTACRSTEVGRVIAVLSADVYGRVEPDELPLDESAPFRPISPYAASKAAADMVCLQTFLGYGLDVIRARPFTHIGPGQGPGFVASAFAKRVAAAERDHHDSISVGPLETRRDFTDVRDVVKAYRLLAQHGVAGAAYNICSGVDITVQHLADTLLRLANRPISLERDPALDRPADVPVLRGDPRRIHDLTGWSAEISLEETLSDLLDDWRVRIKAE